MTAQAVVEVGAPLRAPRSSAPSGPHRTRPRSHCRDEHPSRPSRRDSRRAPPERAGPQAQCWPTGNSPAPSPPQRDSRAGARARTRCQLCRRQRPRPSRALRPPPSDPDAVRTQASTLLAELDPPDAVLAAADGTALAVLDAARELDREVGADLLVASCIDSPAMGFVTPGITAIEAPSPRDRPRLGPRHARRASRRRRGVRDPPSTAGDRGARLNHRTRASRLTVRRRPPVLWESGLGGAAGAQPAPG
jgi:hypothetical protein